MLRSGRSFRKTWAAPIVLAVVVLAGLLSALLGVQILWKALSWIALALPVGVILWFAWLRPKMAARMAHPAGAPRSRSHSTLS